MQITHNNKTYNIPDDKLAEYEVKKSKFELEIGQYYWVILGGVIVEMAWRNDARDKAYLECGDAFLTEEAAAKRKAIFKIKRYISEQRWDWKPDWKILMN